MENKSDEVQRVNEETNNKVQEVSSEEEEVNRRKKIEISLRLFVWQHFSKIPRGQKAKCRYCGKTYAAQTNSRTTSLKNHLNECRVCKKLKVANGVKQHTLIHKNGKGNGGGTVKVMHVGFNREDCRMTFVKMTVKDKLPFRFVEVEEFLELMETCCSKFKVPYRRKIIGIFLNYIRMRRDN